RGTGPPDRPARGPAGRRSGAPGGTPVRRPDPRYTRAARLPGGHDGAVRRRRHRGPGGAGRDDPGRPGTADRGKGTARTVARPGRQPPQAPGPSTYIGPPARTGNRRRPPRRPAHRHRAAGVRYYRALGPVGRYIFGGYYVT